MDIAWVWLLVAVIGTLVSLGSIVLYFRSNPTGHYSLERKPDNEPKWARLTRFIGVFGLVLGAGLCRPDSGWPWTSLVVLLGGFAVVFTAVIAEKLEIVRTAPKTGKTAAAAARLVDWSRATLYRYELATADLNR